MISEIGSSTTVLMPVEAFVAADTKNKVLSSNLHQRSRVGSPEKWAAVLLESLIRLLSVASLHVRPCYPSFREIRDNSQAVGLPDCPHEHTLAVNRPGLTADEFI